MTEPDPRYPTGPFKSAGRPLTAEERARHIDSIAAFPAHMRKSVADLSDEQLDTPYREGGWTVRQLVHHTMDSHMNAYLRFKLAVTEDHPTLVTYDQDAWATLPDVRDPIDGTLDVLSGLHDRWATFLRALEPAAFARTAHHPEVGDITVDTLLEIYGWHGPHHVAHVTTLRARKGW
ncbi:MAG: putative metal-dependent hydrolase [Gemmatimonadota bacterium]|nr:putative metal-dependent hydrolase [Gemmatimonadota bacterium]